MTSSALPFGLEVDNPRRLIIRIGPGTGFAKLSCYRSNELGCPQTPTAKTAKRPAHAPPPLDEYGVPSASRILPPRSAITW